MWSRLSEFHSAFSKWINSHKDTKSKNIQNPNPQQSKSKLKPKNLNQLPRHFIPKKNKGRVEPKRISKKTKTKQKKTTKEETSHENQKQETNTDHLEVQLVENLSVDTVQKDNNSNNKIQVLKIKEDDERDNMEDDITTNITKKTSSADEIPTRTCLYVILCSQNKRYVGLTDKDPSVRFCEHLSGNDKAAEYCKLYVPIQIESVLFLSAEEEKVKYSIEDDRVLDLMYQHGIDNVRGGRFSTCKLDPSDLRSIQRNIAHIKNLCFICHHSGHYAKNCPTKEKERDTERKQPGKPFVTKSNQQNKNAFRYESQHDINTNTTKQDSQKVPISNSATATNTTTVAAVVTKPLSLSSELCGTQSDQEVTITPSPLKKSQISDRAPIRFRCGKLRMKINNLPVSVKTTNDNSFIKKQTYLQDQQLNYCKTFDRMQLYRCLICRQYGHDELNCPPTYQPCKFCNSPKPPNTEDFTLVCYKCDNPHCGFKWK